jgi:hypothetical protein
MVLRRAQSRVRGRRQIAVVTHSIGMHSHSGVTVGFLELFVTVVSLLWREEGM